MNLPDTERGFLSRVNPLVKLAASLVPMGIVYFASGVTVPLAFLCLALAVLLTGALPPPGRTLLALAGGALLLAWLTVLFALLASPGASAGTDVALGLGPLELRTGALEFGAGVAARLGAIVSLSLLAGARTSPERLRRALVTQLRVPYRFAYAALAGLQFVPVFRAEAETIRAAHQVRGVTDPRGPLGAARRTARMLVPLLAGGIRHAERVSLAMEARGFAAYPSRTERVPSRLTRADLAYAVAALVLTAIATLLPVLPLPLPLPL
ncbi:hypothetical protein GCM10009801_18030 [Streptomyces albiaxialis]|uniref:Cobalt ABC transporter permease n=1 Tax=Streptomyces albiaxialis TaxID=329523 RepID=A0ABN2VQ96_9ACTN